MTSNSLTNRRGTARKPAICIPPPPPPPTTCPPATIGGWIRGDHGELSYYSNYTAPKQEWDPGWFYLSNVPGPDGHDLRIELARPVATVSVLLFWWVDGGEAYNFEKYDLPFEWCTHQNITISEWDHQSNEDATCTINLQW